MFTFERETKNTYRFAEEVAEGDNVAPLSSDSNTVIGVLYIQKSAFGENEKPRRISVTVEVVE
jgi:hypothetical protein